VLSRLDHVNATLVIITSLYDAFSQLWMLRVLWPRHTFIGVVYTGFRAPWRNGA